MSQLGLGVMIGMLGGNKESVEALQSSIGKKIKAVSHDDDALYISFEDGAKLRMADEGQSCCESRYMRTDDKLDSYVGGKLMGMELAEAPSISGEYENHDVQFLHVKTSKGTFTMSNHNEHNGYYAGFWIQASLV